MKLIMTIMRFIRSLLGGGYGRPTSEMFYRASGYVYTKDQVWAIPGVVVICGWWGSVMTADNGNWVSPALSGTVPIRVQRLGFSFNPASREVTAETAGVLFWMNGFTDSFDDLASGWPMQGSLNEEFSYRSGEYEMATYRAGLVIWAYAPCPVSGDHYTIRVNCRAFSGTQGHYGILFDIDGNNQFYYFGIDPFKREYFLRKRVAGDWVTPDSISRRFTPAINSDSTASNLMEVRKTGAQVELRVNGLVIGGFSSELAVERVGLISGSDDLITTRFDNFECLDNFSAATSPEVKPAMKSWTWKGSGESSNN